jgi:hypothetical protein
MTSFDILTNFLPSDIAKIVFEFTWHTKQRQDVIDEIKNSQHGHNNGLTGSNSWYFNSYGNLDKWFIAEMCQACGDYKISYITNALCICRLSGCNYFYIKKYFQYLNLLRANKGNNEKIKKMTSDIRIEFIADTMFLNKKNLNIKYYTDNILSFTLRMDDIWKNIFI